MVQFRHCAFSGTASQSIWFSRSQGTAEFAMPLSQWLADIRQWYDISINLDQQVQLSMAKSQGTEEFAVPESKLCGSGSTVVWCLNQLR